MKRSNSTVVLMVACIVASMTSCVFAPKDVYKAENNKGTTSPEVTSTVDLGLSQDTVYVLAKSDYSYSSNPIKFNFKCNTGDIIQVKSIIDGNDEKASIYLNSKYASSTSNNLSTNQPTYTYFDNTINSIMVYAGELALGTHTLELQFITRSGTGSIADNLGGEGYITKKWTIIAGTNNYSVKDTVVNGFEKLYWGAYKGSDFKEYVVYADNNKFEKHLRTNYLIDTSYVGQGRTYSVSVIKKDGTSMSIGSLNVFNNLVNIKPAYIKGVGMVLKLENNKYYNAIDSVFIFLTRNSDSIVIRKKYTQDSVFNVDGAINVDYSGSVMVTPKDRYWYSKNYNKYNYNRSVSNFKIGQQFIKLSYNNLKYLAAISNDEFIYSNNDDLFRYSISDQQSYSPAVKVCNKSNYWLSSSKKTMFYLDECDLKLRTVSTANGISNSKNYTTSSYSPTAGVIAISDVETKLIYDSQNNGMYIVNMNTGDVIAKNDSIESYAYSVTGKLSSNGKYVLYNASSKMNLYSISGSSFTKIWSNISYYSSYYEFNSENNDEFVYQTESTFHIKSTKTGEDLSTYWLGDEIYCIDFKNNEMLTYSSPYLRVRNLKDGSLIKEFKTDYCYKGDVILLNNVLVFKSGVLYFVK